MDDAEFFCGVGVGVSGAERSGFATSSCCCVVYFIIMPCVHEILPYSVTHMTVMFARFLIDL